MKNARERAIFSFDDANSRRVSYVLATKNREKFIAEALKKAKDLLGPDDELLVVDGGSSDRTPEIVESFGDLVSVFLSEPDRDGYEASNKGVMLARGKFIYIMSDDDMVYREGIERAVKTLENNPEIDMLVCGGIRMFGLRPVPYWIPPGTNYGSEPEDAFVHKACGMGFFYRRRAFAKFGLFNSIAADLDFVARLIFKGGVVKFCRINLFTHQIFPHSVIMSKRAAHRKARYLVAKQYCLRSFYFKYRIITAVRESRIAELCKKFSRFLRIKVLKKPFKRKDKKAGINYIWDGGFS